MRRPLHLLSLVSIIAAVPLVACDLIKKNDADAAADAAATPLTAAPTAAPTDTSGAAATGTATTAAPLGGNTAGGAGGGGTPVAPKTDGGAVVTDAGLLADGGRVDGGPAPAPTPTLTLPNFGDAGLPRFDAGGFPVPPGFDAGAFKPPWQK